MFVHVDPPGALCWSVMVRPLRGSPESERAADATAILKLPVMSTGSSCASHVEPGTIDRLVASDRQVEMRPAEVRSSYSSCRRATSQRPKTCSFQPSFGRERAAYCTTESRK